MEKNISFFTFIQSKQAKVLTLEKFENEETLEFETEKIKHIDHQNFARFYEAKILPINRPFLLLEYIHVMLI